MQHDDPPQKTYSKLWLAAVLPPAILFLSIQFFIPISPFFVEPHDARTDFSWDMFAVRRDCEVCTLRFRTARNPTLQRVKWGTWFRSPYHVARSRVRARLPLLARNFCARNEKRLPGLEVYIDCKCRYNKSETLYDLDPLDGANYCTPEAARTFDDPSTTPAP